MLLQKRGEDLCQRVINPSDPNFKGSTPLRIRNPLANTGKRSPLKMIRLLPKSSEKILTRTSERREAKRMGSDIKDRGHGLNLERLSRLQKGSLPRLFPAKDRKLRSSVRTHRCSGTDIPIHCFLVSCYHRFRSSYLLSDVQKNSKLAYHYHSYLLSIKNNGGKVLFVADTCFSTQPTTITYNSYSQNLPSMNYNKRRDAKSDTKTLPMKSITTNINPLQFQSNHLSPWANPPAADS